jgi:branched-subunit amino acid transport protein AzlD
MENLYSSLGGLIVEDASKNNSFVAHMGNLMPTLSLSSLCYTCCFVDGEASQALHSLCAFLTISFVDVL